MTDQCIVCLNDLEVSSESPPLLDQPVLSSDETAELTEVDPVAPARGNATVGEDRIACLIPCTHTFHDACLRLWVERCNSCPICRQTFSTVNIVSKVGGKLALDPPDVTPPLTDRSQAYHAPLSGQAPLYPPTRCEIAFRSPMSTFHHGWMMARSHPMGPLSVFATSVQLVITEIV